MFGINKKIENRNPQTEVEMSMNKMLHICIDGYAEAKGLNLNFGKNIQDMTTPELLEFQQGFFAMQTILSLCNGEMYSMTWGDGTVVSSHEEKRRIFSSFPNIGNLYGRDDDPFVYDVGYKYLYMRSDFVAGAKKSWAVHTYPDKYENVSYAAECVVRDKEDGFYAEFSAWNSMLIGNINGGAATLEDVSVFGTEYHVDIKDGKWDVYFVSCGTRIDATTLKGAVNVTNSWVEHVLKNVYHSFMEWLSTLIDVTDMLPVSKYVVKDLTMSDPNPDYDFDPNINRINHFGNYILPNQVSKLEMDWIGTEMVTKKILNRAYENAHGVTKKFFGDINEIKDMDRLMFSVIILRAFKSYSPDVFENMEYDPFFIQNMKSNDNRYDRMFSFDDKVEHYIDSVNKFTEIFGKRPDLMRVMFARQPHAARLILESLSDFEDEGHREAVIRTIKQQGMDINQIHEYLDSEKQKARIKNVKIDTQLKKQFDCYHENKIDDNVTVIVPQESHDYLSWGAMQNNCIGSYASMANDENMIILGFKANNGKWLGHAKVLQNSIYGGLWLEQLLGKGNTVLPINERNVIVAFFEKEGINCQHYTGMSEPDLV